jgi:hypothetical protein
VRAFCRSEYSYRTYLTPLEADGTDRSWLAGACWLLAEALRRAVGGEIIGIEDGGMFSSRRARSVGHVALWLHQDRGDDWLIDADGAFRPEAFLKKERELEHLIEPSLVPFTQDIQRRWRASGTGTPPADHEALTARLATDLQYFLRR